MTKVYIAGAIPEVGLNLLKEHFEVDMYDGEGLIDKETLKRVEHADALIVYYQLLLIKILLIVLITLKL